ncbi:MAG TPA: hypothetical protein VFU46_06055 [Gemmatimonadales bacterium]|nr:hypothetical protein [Gemmatimonadales bacterium]
MPASRPGSSLETALAVWRRRKWLALPIFLIPFAAFLGAAQALPDVYEATATVMVGPHPQDPDRLDAPAISELETRLRMISEQMLSRSRLSALVRRFDLYADRSPQTRDEDLTGRLRRDIRLDFKEVQDQFVWRTTTIGLAISYRSGDPDVVAPVANALAELFVAENAKMREEYVTGTVELLAAQLEEARRRLEELERHPGAARPRDLDAAAQRYQLVLRRYEDAALAQRLEGRLRDAQLRVLDPAVPPRGPVAPRRAMILLMGLMLSAGTAGGAAVLADIRDTSFHTLDDLRTFTIVPVLATIPPIVTRTDRWARTARLAAGAAAVGMAAAAAWLGVASLAHGNDLLVRILTPDRF